MKIHQKILWLFLLALSVGLPPLGYWILSIRDPVQLQVIKEMWIGWFLLAMWVFAIFQAIVDVSRMVRGIKPWPRRRSSKVEFKFM